MRKSFRIGKGARINLSRSGVGASFGVKGLRFGVGPRGARLTVGGRRVGLSSSRRATRRRTSSADSGKGCLFALGGLVGLFILAKVIEFLMTPLPWIMAGIGGVVFGGIKLTQLFRQQRSQANYLLAVAALVNGDSDGKQLKKVAPMSDEADACMLLAAHATTQREIPTAIEWVKRASQNPSTSGRLSGGAWLHFVGLPDPVYLSADALPEEAIQLVYSHLLVCAGEFALATQSFRAEPASPRYALGVSVLATAYLALGQHEAALAGLRGALCVDGISDPLASSLRRLLARVYDERGHAAYAFEHYKWLAERGDADALAWTREFSVEQARQQRAAQAAEDQRVLEDALARLEKAKGPAGRRKAVERGLKSILDPGRREQLLVAASTREVEAVLTKVRKLKTAKAKRRHLVAALEKLQADDVPDELQVREFQLIERELASLEAGR